MRITYVCTDPGVPVFGSKGASIHVQEVIRALLALGNDVTLLARRTGGDAPADLASVRVVPLPGCPGGSAVDREQWLLQSNTDTRAAIFEAGECDLVYERHALWSYAAMESAQAMGVPGVLEVNAPLVQEQAAYRSLHNVAAALDTERRVFHSASAILAVSEGVAQHIRRAAPACGDIRVVPNGVDTDRFHPGVAPLLPAPGVCTVGFVGSLKPWHGVELLIDAFNALHSCHPHTRLLIVGDGPERAALERRAGQHISQASVVFTGAMEASRVPGLITSMDIAAAPYPQADGCYFSPLKLFEYMACARPVVASRTGQVRDVLRDGVDGVLCRPGDVLALTSALTTLVNNPELRASLGTSARRAMLASHTWRDVGSAIMAMGSRMPRGVT